MTTPWSLDRDGGAIEALVADRYLEALLAAADRRAVDVPSDAALPAELRDVTRVLRGALVRVHPSFRFEERLASRLGELAAARARTAAGDRSGTGLGPKPAVVPGSTVPVLLPFSRTAALVTADDRPGSDDRLVADDPLMAAILAGQLDPGEPMIEGLEARLAGARRPLIVGGAITSAAISLVGVAWVAWRAARPATAGGLSGGGIGGRA